MLNAGMTSARIDLTWGPVEYHKRSLRALMEACRRTKRLCGVMVDTLGREIFVKRDVELDPHGWPYSGTEMHFKKGEQVISSTSSESSTECHQNCTV
jgi:pyruvate kinase